MPTIINDMPWAGIFENINWDYLESTQEPWYSSHVIKTPLSYKRQKTGLAVKGIYCFVLQKIAVVG